MSIWRWRAEEPTLRTALEARQAADDALAEHDRQMRKEHGYGWRGVVPQTWERELLERASWDSLQKVLDVRAQQKQQRQAEKDARSWERFKRWTTAIDSTVDKYRLTRWSRMTEQERWDEAAELNEDLIERQELVARIADRFGLKRVAEEASKKADSGKWWAERAENCPNNPRNGGDGFGRAGFRNGKNWTEWRGPDWEYVEDYEERLDRESFYRSMESEVDPLTPGRAEALRQDLNSDEPSSSHLLHRFENRPDGQTRALLNVSDRDERDAPLRWPTAQEWADAGVDEADRTYVHNPDDPNGLPAGFDEGSDDGSEPDTSRPYFLDLINRIDAATSEKRTRRFDGEPETPAETRFFDLRESGFDGWIDQDGYAVACPSCGDADCTKGLTEHHTTDGGSAMTAPTASPSALSGDIQTIGDLRALNERTAQGVTSDLEVFATAGQNLREAATAYEAAVGGIAGEHDPETRSETSAVMEALLEVARLTEEIGAASDSAQAALQAALQGLERHRALEEAVQSHAGPAPYTASYGGQ